MSTDHMRLKMNYASIFIVIKNIIRYKKREYFKKQKSRGVVKVMLYSPALLMSRLIRRIQVEAVLPK